MGLIPLQIQAFLVPRQGYMNRIKQPGGMVAESSYGDVFEAQFNPETIVVTGSKAVKSHDSITRKTKTREVLQNNPKTYQFTLVLDATGATGKPKMDVGAEIDAFMKTAYYNEPSFQYITVLGVAWGTFRFYCILESITITYKLFDAEGKPIRATLDCKFQDLPGDEESAFSHAERKVPDPKASNPQYDLLSAQGYGSARGVTEGARKSGLDSLRGEGVAVARRIGQVL